MRPDQKKRIEDLTEKLADQFIFEADPTEWSGNGVAPAEMSQEDRGNRYWCKKNAMATGGVLRFAMDIAKHDAMGAGTVDPEEAEREFDDKINDAEKRAKAAVNRALSKAKSGA